MNLIKLIGKTVTYLTDVFHYLNRYECCLQRLNHAYLYRGIGAICVQRFDDSLNPAVRITYRISRRSSSYSEPRDPSLSDVVCFKVHYSSTRLKTIIVLIKNKCCAPTYTWGMQ